jgi:hypothetical protein
MQRIPKFVIKHLNYLNKFPYGQVCRHLAAVDLLDNLIKEFPEFKDNPDVISLVNTFVNCQDFDTAVTLEKLEDD